MTSVERNLNPAVRTRITSLFLTVLATAALLAGGVSSASAQEGGATVSADLTYVNRYVWRGLLLTDDPVMQPSLTAGYGGLSVNLWANTDLTGVNGTPGEMNELDYTVDYSFAVGGIGVSLGAVQYTFPHTGYEPTAEIYAGATLDTFLSPSLTFYQDVDEADGYYVSLGGEYGTDLGAPGRDVSTTLGMSFSVGFASADWNDFYYGVDSSGPVDLLVSVDLTFDFGGVLSVTPSAAISKIIDSDLEDAVEDPDVTTFGITLSMAL